MSLYVKSCTCYDEMVTIYLSIYLANTYIYEAAVPKQPDFYMRKLCISCQIYVNHMFQFPCPSDLENTLSPLESFHEFESLLRKIWDTNN